MISGSRAIPILVPEVPLADKLMPYLKDIDENKIYSNFGPLNQRLKDRLGKYTGVKSENIATCSNATLAIQGLMQTDPKDSHEWSMPVWTFTATAAAALNSGRSVKFVDTRANWRADFGENRVFHHSLLDVAPFGDSINLASIDTCESLIIDAAPSFDAVAQIKLHTKFPVAIVISLHATKLMPAGEGAFVISNSSEWIRNFESWTNFGMNADRESQFVGTNAKMSEYSSAVAHASLDSWQKIRSSVLAISDTARQISHNFGFSTSPAMERGLATPYWVLVLNDPTQKANLIKNCEMEAIGWRDWWKHGVHRMPAYCDKANGKFPNTDLYASVTIGLPFHSHLTDGDFARIEQAIERSRQ